MILTVDVGNTRIKSAVFENDTLVEVLVFPNENFLASIENILKKFPKITVLAVASVG